MKEIVEVGNITLYIFENYAVITEKSVMIETNSQIRYNLDDIFLDYSIGRESFEPKSFSGINYTVNGDKVVSKSINKPPSKIIGFFKHVVNNILPQMDIELSFITRDENGKKVQRTYTSDIKRNISPIYIKKIKRVKSRIDNSKCEQKA